MRKPKLTEALQDDICRHIESGQFQGIAAQLAGVHEATFWRWMAEGEDTVDERGTVLKAATPRKREFREAVTRAKVRAEAAMALTVRLAAQNGDWKAAAFWLERVQHERWGRKTKTELTGKGDGPIQTQQLPADLSGLSDADLDTLERIYANAAGRQADAAPDQG
jgi:hypothetical protein